MKKNLIELAKSFELKGKEIETKEIQYKTVKNYYTSYFDCDPNECFECECIIDCYRTKI